MKRNLVAAILAGIIGSSAFAHAGASVTLDDVSASLQASGTSFGDDLIHFSLAPSQTEVLTLSFTAHLSSDGLPATRVWDYGGPALDAYPGPAPTGSEQSAVWAAFLYDGRHQTDDNDMLSVTSTAPAFYVLTSPGTLDASGTITVTITNLSDVFSQSGTGLILAEAFVDATPVPEPAVASMTLAGLLALGLAARRRAHGVTPR